MIDVDVPTTLGQVVTLIEGVISESQLSATYDIWAINLYDPAMYWTAAALFISGVLASASGIGGGGIFVAILMIVGGLSPHQSIPLSKALIFSGSVMSFIVNSRKRDSRGQLLIQVELVKNIVPMALGGTLLGVMLNLYVPRAILVLLLAALLTFMTFRLIKQAMKAYNAENAAKASEPLIEAAVKRPQDTPTTTTSGEGGDRMYFEERTMVLRSSLAIYRDSFIMILLLGAVITCGALRHYLPPDSALPNVIMVGGIMLCACVCILFRQPCMSTSNDAEGVSIGFPVVAFCAGICSGLMGIGGGLIFAPYLLMSGLDPTKAVVTSATCVVFTATSTTLQYVLLGRVMIYQAIFFGIVTFFSSVVGTQFIHWVKKATGRSSPLVFIVSVAVGISCVLCIFKGIGFAREDWGSIRFHVSFGFWVAQIAGAFGWKLTTSMDDIMWLSPFLAQTRDNTGATFGKLALYIMVVQTVVFVASCIVWGSEWLGQYLAHGGRKVNVHGYLLLFSGSMLLCYALHLLREWYEEKFGHQEEEEEEEGTADLTTKRLLIVSFLGQLDELASFTSALLGGFFAPFSLSIGCFFACFVIASMCVGALKVKAIADCILSVPVWLIIGTLSIMNITNGLSALME